ncbi:OmpA family protein [Fluviicola chungangensis]|uniref:OmpA family protein n=1 Tax=Fluviicola chungangensis TaxID=2597671 RepID=A0A556MQA7_9FLAO|nr:OmpA family protein [Fluviicola chungangensis]TSJ42100.1 OmpA family protein [Fluviicola chungangensis]
MGIKRLLVFITVLFLQESDAFSQEFIQTKCLDSLSVFFKFGSYEIENPQRLIARCSRIKATSGKIKITSYTDTIGSQKSNQKLAAKRLNSVSKILRSTSLSSFAIDSINKNEQRDLKKKLNDSTFRRVDIVIYSVENKFKLNSPINLDINFVSETYKIVPESSGNLKTLLSILQDDSTLNVQLNGHVCCRPGQELSEQRALAVKKYLVSNGIESNRIECKGFSNSIPLFPRTDIQNVHKNMRVEVVFIKKETH